MPDNIITTLMLGDVYAEPGCRVIFSKLPSIIKKYKADYVIVNGENAAPNGFGITEQNMTTIFGAGADVITSGNHIWQTEEIFDFLQSKDTLLRPANFSGSLPGHGYVIYKDIGVINLQGREMMKPIEDPFKCAADIVRQMRGKVKAVYVDFHAESTEEKEALAYFLDGDVTAVAGTHTHVQTADERILPKGSAYITDLGMCGVCESVIGCDVSIALGRYKTMVPAKPDSSDGQCRICGVCITSDPKTLKAIDIQRICE